MQNQENKTSKKSKQEFDNIRVALTKSDIINNITIKTSGIINKNKMGRLELDNKIEKIGDQMGLPIKLVENIKNSYFEFYNKISNSFIAADKTELTSKLVKKYQFWTDGHCFEADNIDDYVSKKDSYMFWIDITKKEHLCFGKPSLDKSKSRIYLKNGAINILKILVNEFDKPVQIEDIINEYSSGSVCYEDAKNLIQQYFTQLHKFANEDFRKRYLTSVLNNSVCLKGEFKDKYFIFETKSSKLKEKHQV